MSYSLGQDEGPEIPDYLLEERANEEAAAAAAAAAAEQAKTQAVIQASAQAKSSMIPLIAVAALGVWFLTKK